MKKSPGPGGINPELFKYGLPKLLETRESVYLSTEQEKEAVTETKLKKSTGPGEINRDLIKYGPPNC